jgi:hypothetical protein
MKKRYLIITILLLQFFVLNSFELKAKDSDNKEKYCPDPAITALIASNPAIIEEKIRIAMSKVLNNPATLTIDITYKDDVSTTLGIFENVLVKTSRGNIEGLILDKADVEFLNVQIDTKELIEKEDLEPVKMNDIFMNVTIKEEDLNTFLTAKSKSIKVNKPNINLRKNVMELSGSTKYGILRADFFASGNLSVKNKQEIWFHSNLIKLNRMVMPRSFVGLLIKKINPVLNLKSFPFKLNLKSINILPGIIEFTSEREENGKLSRNNQ